MTSAATVVMEQYPHFWLSTYNHCISILRKISSSYMCRNADVHLSYNVSVEGYER